ncbi:MAG: hypothetical protein OEM61_10730, partial [Desulfobacteraceae bacterium]|nr:hypothetical protein [Desulfobacteraceae bacterium]
IQHPIIPALQLFELKFILHPYGVKPKPGPLGRDSLLDECFCLDTQAILMGFSVCKGNKPSPSARANSLTDGSVVWPTMDPEKLDLKTIKYQLDRMLKWIKRFKEKTRR